MLNYKSFTLALVLVGNFLCPAIAQTTGGLPPIRREAPPPTPPIDPRKLINDGWGLFLGRDGYVNELMALKLTLQGIEFATEKQLSHARSVGRNNLTVFYRCSRDPLVRDFQKSMERVKFEIDDMYSWDNIFWDIFYRRSVFPDDEKILDTLTKELPEHLLVKFTKSLGNRWPKDRSEANAVLENAAKQSDPEAALRMAFRFECGEETQEFDKARQWYKTAIGLFEKSGNTIRATSATARLNRLNLIAEGRFR
jgi:hypothetical protein